MTQSAKRYGLEVEGDLELESRLRRIEVAIQQSGLGNQDATSLTRGGGSVPQVSGLRLEGTTPGGFTIRWNAVTISNLRRYDVQFSTDRAFASGVQTFTSANTNWAFTTASTSTYFARVRAVNSAAQVGDWSITLNTTTGQAATGDIEDGAITGPKLDENDVGASLALRGYIDGCILSNNSTDSDHDIDIGAGLCRDSTNVASIVVPALTKRIDASWALGTGNGGLASGATLSADSPYFVFVVSNGEDVDAGFDDNPLASNLLTDLPDATWTLFRRVGCVVTDSVSNILGFTQDGNFFQLNEPIQDIDENPPAANSVLTHTLTHIPVGIRCKVHMSLNWYVTGAINWSGFVQYGPAEATFSADPDGTDNDGRATGDARNVEHTPTIMVNSLGQFKTRQSATTGSLHLTAQVHAWEDLRGSNSTS